jgi:glycerate-2-kinase
LTVNITQPVATGSVFIESDLCMDDGTIVASGPTVEVDVKNSNRTVTLSLWSEEFEAFLDKSSSEVMRVLSEMIANREKSVRKPRIV